MTDSKIEVESQIKKLSELAEKNKNCKLLMFGKREKIHSTLVGTLFEHEWILFTPEAVVISRTEDNIISRLKADSVPRLTDPTHELKCNDCGVKLDTIYVSKLKLDSDLDMVISPKYVQCDDCSADIDFKQVAGPPGITTWISQSAMTDYESQYICNINDLKNMTTLSYFATGKGPFAFENVRFDDDFEIGDAPRFVTTLERIENKVFGLLTTETPKPKPKFDTEKTKPKPEPEK